MAAYAARAGAPAQVFMPRDVPPANAAECVLYGAHLHLVAGLIGDCGRLVRQGVAARGWFDLSTLREPYRQEGKKTMGYEIAEQLGWTLPDAIIYPTGGGTGIVGMWKAVEEGISAAPEGAATLAALRLLLARGALRADERIVLFNTGAAWKYMELVPMPALPVLDPDDPRALDDVVTAR